MEGVGARLGRSSTRYGPATVFTGPVRKWKKKWVPLAPNSHHHNNSNHHHINGTPSTSITIIGNSNGNGSSSHLLLYKWTPLAPNNKDTNSTPNNNKDQDPDEPPRRKFKYLPVYLLDNEKKEAADKEAAESIDDEAKPIDADPNAKSDAFDEKPDINDVPMDENQDDDQVVRQDLNESLDLSLGLNSCDGGSDSKPDHSRDGQSERANGSSGRA